MHLNREPREWQIAAYNVWRPQQRGVVSAVTGAGKTTFGLLCVTGFLERYANGSILIIAPTRALADQWAVSLQVDMNVSPNEIGFLKSSTRFEVKRFTISVINSARTRTAEITRGRPCMLLLDECHRAGSESNAQIFAGKFQSALGLSATPKRQYDDGFEAYVVPAVGNVIFEYTYEDAFRDGIIVPFDLYNVRFQMTGSEEAEYAALTKKIARLMHNADVDPDSVKSILMRRARLSWNSPLRVPLAAKIAQQHRDQGTIVFHEAINRATEIHSVLLKLGVRATMYHTGLSDVARRENLRLFRLGHYRCMVSCRALDEGLDIPGASVGIIASGTASPRQRIQRLGRVLRQAEGKPSARVYTLYGTTTEETRLRNEAESLRGTASVRWLEMGIPNSG